MQQTFKGDNTPKNRKTRYQSTCSVRSTDYLNSRWTWIFVNKFNTNEDNINNVFNRIGLLFFKYDSGVLQTATIRSKHH